MCAPGGAPAQLIAYRVFISLCKMSCVPRIPGGDLRNEMAGPRNEMAGQRNETENKKLKNKMAWWLENETKWRGGGKKTLTH